MQCIHCNLTIPENALKCNWCRKKIANCGSTYSIPYVDQYGNETTELYPNKEKRNARDCYLMQLPEYAESKRLKRKIKMQTCHKQDMTFLYFLTILFLWLVMIIIADIVSPVSFVAPIILTAIPIVDIYVLKESPAQKKLKQRIAYIELHNTPIHFYATEDVLGYSLLNNIKKNDDNSQTFYFAFYEINKQDIQSIDYDKKYGEYIFNLRKPCYNRYDLEPSYQFRIADVFDDHVLPDVLGYDLPPKDMPF